MTQPVFLSSGKPPMRTVITQLGYQVGVGDCQKPCSNYVLVLQRGHNLLRSLHLQIYSLCWRWSFCKVLQLPPRVFENHRVVQKTKGLPPWRLSKRAIKCLFVVVNTVTWKGQKSWVKSLQNEKTGPDINETITWSDFGLSLPLEFPLPIPSPATQQLLLRAIPKSVRLSAHFPLVLCPEIGSLCPALESLYQVSSSHSLRTFFSTSTRGSREEASSVFTREEGRGNDRRCRTVLILEARSHLSLRGTQY